MPAQQPACIRIKNERTLLIRYLRITNGFQGPGCDKRGRIRTQQYVICPKCRNGHFDRTRTERPAIDVNLARQMSDRWLVGAPHSRQVVNAFNNCRIGTAEICHV